MSVIKKSAIISIMAVMILVMCSCGAKYAGSDYVGVWKGTVASMGEVEINVSDVIGDFIIELNEDGTASLNASDRSGECEWEETDKGLNIIENDEILEFVAEGDKLVTIQQECKIYFEKE